MMHEINSHEPLNLQKISDSIQRLQNLKILDLISALGSFGSLFKVEDILTKSQYVIKIISIFNGYDDICQEKLENAKKEAYFLMLCSHPNVVQYVSQFQIEYNYFIQMENCETNLEQWIEDQNNSIISRHQFITFACQTLSVIQYFHNKNYVLKDLSLKNILIDKYNRIKVCNFGKVTQVNSEQSYEMFLSPQSKNEIFYFPPEIINQQKEQLLKINKGYEQIYLDNIWAFGICFSILGGATYKDLLSIHISGYKHIKQLDEDINWILQKVLSLQPNERPNIQQIFHVFEFLKQKIWNPQQASILFSEYEKIKCDNIKKALELILICVDISPENINYLDELERIQFENNYFDEAIKQCQKCLKIDPKRNIYKLKGMVNEAIKQYEKCLEINPQYQSCYNILGFTYKNNGNVDKAIKLYKQYLKLNPEDHIYYNHLGIAYQKKGKSDKAIQSYKKSLIINSQDYFCHFNLGNAYVSKGLVDEAIESFQKCLELNPQYESCHFNLGNAYKRKKMFDNAIKQYQSCLEINPKNIKCNLNIGISYFYKGMLDQTHITYQKCVKICPEDLISHFNLGNSFENKDMFNEAIKCYKKCLELDPSWQAVLDLKIKLCKQQI